MRMSVLETNPKKKSNFGASTLAETLIESNNNTSIVWIENVNLRAESSSLGG